MDQHTKYLLYQVVKDTSITINLTAKPPAITINLTPKTTADQEPKNNEPKVDEPKNNEPKVDEPKVDEPEPQPPQESTLANLVQLISDLERVSATLKKINTSTVDKEHTEVFFMLQNFDKLLNSVKNLVNAVPDFDKILNSVKKL
jgi:hypothetical protein